MQAEFRIIGSVHAVQSMTPTDDFFTSKTNTESVIKNGKLES